MIKMKRLLKKIKTLIKRMDEARTFGSWKLGFKIKLPNKRDNDFYYEREKAHSKPKV